MISENNLESNARRYVRKDNLVMRKIADEFILIPITQVGADLQKVYNMNHSAAAIWQCLESPFTIERIVLSISKEYGIDTEAVRVDVQDTLNFLVERGFCLVQDEG